MTNRHLTDEELQLYAIDKTRIDENTIMHISGCEECKEKAVAYEVLMSAIASEETPAFDFDLAEAVMAKLPAAQKQATPVSYTSIFFILVSVLITGLVFYFFRENFNYLFGGITALATYLVIVTAALLLTALGFDMYKTYQKKIDSLNYY